MRIINSASHQAPNSVQFSLIFHFYQNGSVRFGCGYFFNLLMFSTGNYEQMRNFNLARSEFLKYCQILSSIPQSWKNKVKHKTTENQQQTSTNRS